MNRDKEVKCGWTYYEKGKESNDCGIESHFTTHCGYDFDIIEIESEQVNDFKFCPFCGDVITVRYIREA